MSLYSSAIGLVAGICLGFSVLHLFIGLRRKEGKSLYLTFALFSLGYGGTLLLGIAYHGAVTVDQFIALNRWDALFIPAAFIGLVWYIANYTGIAPRPLLWGLTAAYAAVGLAQFIRPTLTFETIDGLAYAVLPWGEQLAYLEGTPAIWETVFSLAQLLTLGYVIVAGLIQFRRGQRRGAMYLILGFTGFIVALAIEIAGSAGIIPYVPVAEIAFVGIALAVSLQMADRAIRTEETLAHYSSDQELLVATRTAELEQSNLELSQQIEERQLAMHSVRESERRFRILHEMAVFLADQTDLPSALINVSQRINGLLDARYTFILTADLSSPDRTEIFGFEDTTGPIGPVTMDFALETVPYIQQALSSRQTQVLSGIDVGLLDSDLQREVKERQLANVLLVPLLTRQLVVGCLSVATERIDRHFTSAEVDLAETVASDVAQAVINARLVAQAQETAVIEERGRLARDLHDAVTQTVYSASLITEALPTIWKRSPDEGERNLLKLRQLVRGALAEMRTLLFELRPAALEAAKLVSLLHYLSDAFTGRSRIPVVTELDNPEPLPVRVKMGLYRITQEAFNNIEKHAGASEASLSLARRHGQVVLTLQDNGRGFVPAEVPQDRMGLHIMRERVAELDGRLELESKPGRGTQLTIVVPFVEVGTSGENHD